MDVQEVASWSVTTIAVIAMTVAVAVLIVLMCRSKSNARHYSWALQAANRAQREILHAELLLDRATSMLPEVTLPADSYRRLADLAYARTKYLTCITRTSNRRDGKLLKSAELKLLAITDNAVQLQVELNECINAPLRK